MNRLEYVIVESYYGYRKIAQRDSKFEIRRYGQIHIKKELQYNQWYNLTYQAIYNDDTSVLQKNNEISTTNNIDKILIEVSPEPDNNDRSDDSDQDLGINIEDSSSKRVKLVLEKQNQTDVNDNFSNITSEIKNDSYPEFSKDERTREKYRNKKNRKIIKCFRILEITPSTLLDYYTTKNKKYINYINTPVLSYINLYNHDDKNTLLFDYVKGIGVYTLGYHNPKNLTIYRKSKGHPIDSLKFLEYEKLENITFFNGQNIQNNKNEVVHSFIESDVIKDNDSENIESLDKIVKTELTVKENQVKYNDYNFDTVIVLGEYDYIELLTKYDGLIGNIIILYVYINTDAYNIFKYLLNNENFIDVSICDFITREWQITENMRPKMDCDMRCGYVVKATKIKKI